MKIHPLVFTALTLASTGVLASPTVEGNLITLPGDDYYQVQRASDYQSLCEGTSSCEVADGTYIVINHTTGERFESVVVPQSSMEEPLYDFQIVDTTLRFPAGDWYQVQVPGTYESLCDGVTECELYPGTFIVINHSTGVRHESVVVGETEPPDVGGTPPSLNGNTISWADDGWYQVQTSEDHQSICEGGFSCEVEPGSYRVINLTTGTRYENIIVSVDNNRTPVSPGELPTGTYPAQLSTADTNAQSSGEPDEIAPPSGTRFVGDVNGDGLEDVSVFLPGEEIFNNTAAILFADAVGNYPDYPLDSSIDAGIDLTLTHGFLIEDVAYEVSGMGDINGDGLDDLRVRGSGFFSLARTALLAGAASFPERLNANTLPEAQVLVLLPNIGSFSPAGDINGDGLPDLLITGPAQVSGGVIYGATDLQLVLNDFDELSEIALFAGCGPTYTCTLRPVGDFDADGFDDLYISRLGAGVCGFASFTAVVYGGSDGIEKRDSFTTYSASDMTRIVGENAGNCFPAAVANLKAQGDVDGDGATDLVLAAGDDSEYYLIFGMADKRRAFVSIDELDGQRGLVIAEEGELALEDVNSDGFDDVVFPDGSAYTGYERDITSIDSPVVRRTPDTFIIYSAGNASATAAATYQITINDVPAGTFDAAQIPLEVTDATDGAQALVAVTSLSDNGDILKTTRRLVPEYEAIENLTATLLEPRLIELTFNNWEVPPSYLNYLIWRDGEPVGRAVAGARTYIDSDVALNTTYTYFVTPDYVMDKSLDGSGVQMFPLIQRQSNSLTVSTPEY